MHNVKVFQKIGVFWAVTPICCVRTLVTLYQTVWIHILDESSFHSHWHVNLKYFVLCPHYLYEDRAESLNKVTDYDVTLIFPVEE
jgi:hypothetical protein